MVKYFDIKYLMSIACSLLDGDVSKIDLVVSAPHGETSERKIMLTINEKREQFHVKEGHYV